ncbi:cation diffusion facilitator family transporter [Candidatus Lokiarchaeum ossiferum]|uniref:cation diffusion facilitator family transporter n=1 Tax=Candidatus Lokiarchaeum ossiferum TaxID=2951803 RepID=UPI00352BFE21
MEEDKQVSLLSISLVISVFLIKITVSFFTNSISFLAELSDSIMDFAAVLITFIALKESKKPADNEHMFGHYKVNSVAGFIQSFLIIGLYCFILVKAISTLINIDEYKPDNSLIAAISLGVVVIIVFFVSQRVVSIGKKTKNQAIIAQGLNFRGDFYRNISVIIGLVISSFGLALLDPIIAGIFSIISIVDGIKVLRQSFNELIDANAINDDLIEEIKIIISEIDGVSHIDSLALKTAGTYLDATISICLDEQYSVLHGNAISNQIRTTITEACLGFDCNIFIQFNLNDPSKSINYFDEIREHVKQDEKEYDIHNIIIDRFKNVLLVQYHIKLAPDLNLVEAHTLATNVEESILQRLQKFSEGREILVISHIEPAERKEKSHSHSFEQHEREDVRSFLNGLISDNIMILGFHDLKIIEDKKEFTLIVSITLKSSLTVEIAHNIAEKLEYDLHFAFNNLDHCLIHTEPQE